MFLNRRKVCRLLIYLVLFGTGTVEGPSGKQDSGEENAESSSSGLSLHLRNQSLKHRRYAELGQRRFDRRKFYGALRYYDKAINKKPREPEYYRLRGDCLLSMGLIDRAISDFRKAVEEDPQNKARRVFLINTLFDHGKFDEAVDATLPAGAHQLVKLGDKLVQENKFDEAIRCFTAAINEKPDKKPTYYRKRGLCYQKMQNLEEAISDYKKVVELVPSSMNKRLELCELLLDAERFDEATEVLENLVENKVPMWLGDIGRAMKMRQKIRELEEAKRRARLEDLHEYSKSLIIADAKNKIGRIKTKIFLYGRKERLREKIRELRVMRDDYLEKLAFACTEYEHGKANAELDDRPTDGDNDDLDIPEYLLDKITFEIMKDPVTTPSGITYDRSSIEDHLKNRRTDPMTRRPLTRNQLIRNRNVSAAIEEWNQEHNKGADVAGPSRS